MKKEVENSTPKVTVTKNTKNTAKFATKKASSKTDPKKTKTVKVGDKDNVTPQTIAQSTIKKTTTKSETKSSVKAVKTAKKTTKKENKTVAKQLSITLMKSPVSKKPRHRQTLIGLGLKKIRQTVERQDTPEVRGMLRKVSYMVDIKEV